MKYIYGYCRISTKQQSIERQERNILQMFPKAIIYKEAFSGRRMDRPIWSKLFKIVNAGDTIVFDSVSRMSRSADEGVKTYFELFEREVNLVFLKEHYIDTAVYAKKEIVRLSRDFLGNNSDKEVMQLIGISRNTYYKFKKAIYCEDGVFYANSKDLDVIHVLGSISET